MQNLISLYRKHALFVLYTLVLILVGIGLCYGFGYKHLPKIGMYFIFFSLSYMGFAYLIKNKTISSVKLPFSFSVNYKILDWILFSSIVFFTAYHLWFLGHVPFISAVKILDYYKIAFIRQSIIEHDRSIIKYISAFMIKGIIPFALLYFSVTNKRLFYLIIPVSIFYAISLMQKGLVVSIMIPLVVLTIINREYLKSLLYTLMAIAGVFVLVYATNPNLRATQEEIRAEMEKNGHLYLQDQEISVGASFLSASQSIYTRVFVTTGLVSGYWFERIPSVYPYAKGCGYHFLAPALGCNFNDYDYSRIIYDATYVKESKIGLKGTVTVANFVYDYANFGYYGLFYSAILLSLFFILLNILFNYEFKWLVSLNALFIFWLSSSSFFTLLLSGGWIITLLLFLLFKNNLLKNS